MIAIERKNRLGIGVPQYYLAAILTKKGSSEFLKIGKLPLQSPGPGQLRVRVRAAGVGATDLLVLAGSYRYAPKIPLVPGYEVAGVVEAIGADVAGFRVGQRVAALTVYGAFAEVVMREAEHFLPIPDAVADRDAAAVILNYGTAWQMIHRVAKVRAGETALVTGAAGGVGTAALQLLRLAGVKTYGAASASKHNTVRSLGAVPIDYRAGALDHLMSALEPNGADYAFDAIGGANIGPCIGALRSGGTLVAFGFMGAGGKFSQLAMFANIFVGARLRGRVGKFYGITMLYRKNPKPLRDDLAKIFTLLAEKKIDPMISRTFPLLEAREALELLASGSVEGKIVLTQDPS
jgi:NADPH:quinone reductase